MRNDYRSRYAAVAWVCTVLTKQLSCESDRAVPFCVVVVHGCLTSSPALVLGLFTWEDHSDVPSNRELDFEFARWGRASDPTNAQFVVQPYK